MPLDRAVIAKLRRKQLGGLYAVAVAMTGRAKQRATKHVDTGTLRNSITQTKRGREVLWGIPLSAASYAPHLELGFTPHFVPAKHIGLWASRHGKAALGLYVGGPGSSLQSAPGGTTGTRHFGKRAVTETWSTQGGTSPYLEAGKVGFPILQPVAEQVRSFAGEAFLRGWRRG